MTKPSKRVWLYLRERFLSHRVLASYTALLDAACQAWNALAAETGRLASYPYRTHPVRATATRMQRRAA
jgi:hypothetical protein